MNERHWSANPPLASYIEAHKLSLEDTSYIARAAEPDALVTCTDIMMAGKGFAS